MQLKQLVLIIWNASQKLFNGPAQAFLGRSWQIWVIQGLLNLGQHHLQFFPFTRLLGSCYTVEHKEAQEWGWDRLSN